VIALVEQRAELFAVLCRSGFINQEIVTLLSAPCTATVLRPFSALINVGKNFLVDGFNFGLSLSNRFCRLASWKNLTNVRHEAFIIVDFGLALPAAFAWQLAFNEYP